MTDNTELQRLMRLRRLGSQIAASLPSNLDREQAFQAHEYVRELLDRQHALDHDPSGKLLISS